MNRVEFMNELETLLSDVTESEREEAIKYYNDYFDDAGIENESSVINELVSPQKVANTIKEDLGFKSSNSSTQDTEEGKFNQNTGYEDRGFKQNDNQNFSNQNFNNQSFNNQNFNNQNFNNQNFNNQNYGNQGYGPNYNQGYNNQGYNQGAPVYQKNPINKALLIVLLIVTCPIWGGFVLGAFGIAMGMFGIIIGFGAAAVALGIAGVLLLGFGIVKCFLIPVGGIFLLGVSLLIISLACLFGLAAYGMVKLTAICIKGVISLCKMPFKRVGGCAA